MENKIKRNVIPVAFCQSAFPDVEKRKRSIMTEMSESNINFEKVMENKQMFDDFIANIKDLAKTKQTTDENVTSDNTKAKDKNKNKNKKKNKKKKDLTFDQSVTKYSTVKAGLIKTNKPEVVSENLKILCQEMFKQKGYDTIIIETKKSIINLDKLIGLIANDWKYVTDPRTYYVNYFHEYSYYDNLQTKEDVQFSFWDIKQPILGDFDEIKSFVNLLEEQGLTAYIKKEIPYYDNAIYTEILNFC